MEVFGIYVFPTVTGLPPRAILIDSPPSENANEASGPLAIWTANDGCWVLEGHPLPAELSDALTTRARELGVESFLN